ncbi:MAG: hypothetical protein DMD75_07880 [Candidatus Rokuibacteriota bacterium]|nr:MAG: hypothetical protein DMD75_07880 [Candidatus Rokubacteria bacterium]
MSLALVGVSALIAASPLAFDALRWAGAAYLIWIGVPLFARAWRDRNAALASGPTPSPRRVYWQGLTTNLLNPKVAIAAAGFVFVGLALRLMLVKRKMGPYRPPAARY